MTTKNDDIEPDKRTLTRYMRRKKRDDAKALEADAGSRLVIREEIMGGEGGGNDRTCLMDAILSIVPRGVNKMELLGDIGDSMPDCGDTSIEDIKGALLRYGLATRVVSQKYIKKKGAAFHLFQEDDCKLLIRLILKNKEDVSMGHFVGYDGNVVYDKPEVLEINREEDNLDRWDDCKEIFGTLYPKTEFNSWQIVGVYEFIRV